jgi:two-component system OmpR family response regulator
MPIEMSSWRKPLDAMRRSALLVEDDPRLQRAMSIELARMDFRVLTAGHYDAAVHQLAMREHYLACIDVGLPNKSGYELCEHIRGSLGLSGLRIIMTSEYGSPQDKSYAEDAGGNAFLRKPFSMLQFTQCVESLSDVSRWSVPLVSELQAVGWKPSSARYFASRRLELAGILAA